eukprot:31181-Pelagococcus_subviridis.AAC.7
MPRLVRHPHDVILPEAHLEVKRRGVLPEPPRRVRLIERHHQVVADGWRAEGRSIRANVGVELKGVS